MWFPHDAIYSVDQLNGVTALGALPLLLALIVLTGKYEPLRKKSLRSTARCSTVWVVVSTTRSPPVIAMRNSSMADEAAQFMKLPENFPEHSCVSDVASPEMANQPFVSS